ncbi:MAG: transporter [Reichenbachiella sp.]|uniref:SphA family protein n=3 Tax=Reichenbachiella sp. TaxID=2184521 RepID=UPI003267979B
MTSKPILTFLSLCLVLGLQANAQNLAQPPGNFGLTTVLDGSPPGPGIFFMEYLSHYSGSLRDPDGNEVKPNTTDAIDISSTLLLNQFVWISNKQILGGNFLANVVVPIVIIDSKSPYDLVGKNGLGDITIGPGIQWFNKKLFGIPYFHRVELDFIIPIGSHDFGGGATPINAGSKFFTFQPYYSQTLMFSPALSVSLRHHLSFNGKYTEVPNLDLRVGNFYHLNYSVDHIIGKGRFQPGTSGETRLGVQGYFGTQLNDDTANDVDIPDSKESVFAIGPQIHHLTKKGLMLEFKVAFETVAKNRPKGIRSTFRILKYLPSKQQQQAAQ